MTAKLFIKILIISFFTSLWTLSKAQNAMFEKLTYSKNGETLPYRFLKPSESTNKSTKLPLVLFLHGAGERGNDNELQLKYVDTIFGSEWFRKKYNSYVVAPQCPTDKRWVDVDWKLPNHTQPEQMSQPMQLVVELINEIVQKYDVDTNRIYVIGLSMGGYGTWDLITRFPNKFAAAVPICGGGDEKTACRIKHLPIWAFHGAKDKVVLPERSRNMIAAIKKCGGKPLYTEYKNEGHLVWNKVFVNQKMWQWMFSQHKRVK